VGLDDRISEKKRKEKEKEMKIGLNFGARG